MSHINIILEKEFILRLKYLLGSTTLIDKLVKILVFREINAQVSTVFGFI